jgi:protein-L-isoaspartate(D-aspartate) O-methyltransferase
MGRQFTRRVAVAASGNGQRMNHGRALARELASTIADPTVLDAIAAVPRERFVPAALRRRAYENVSLPIGGGQTISQPLVVARMLELLALGGDERVLDVGTGSGYHAALLARLAREVISIERDPALSAAAARTLQQIGADNVTCVVGDGWAGVPEAAPFDAINVAATPGPTVPAALIAQLALPDADRPGGRLVAPLGDKTQVLTLLTRAAGDEVAVERFEPVRFVPLVRGTPRRSSRPRRRDGGG